MKLAIATAPHRDSRHWKQGSITWSKIAAWTKDPADHKECGSYVLGTLRETTIRHTADSEPCTGLHRNKVAIVDRSAIALDFDSPKGYAVIEALETIHSYAVIAHTTYSSAPDELRFRMIFPISRSLTPDEYHDATKALVRELGAQDQVDPGSYSPSRYMFKPSAQNRDWFESWVIEGDPVDVDALLSDFVDDLSSEEVPQPHRNKRDPFTLAGIAGAFNRAYGDLAELVEAYNLPYEADGERWHLVGARSIAGMGEIAPGLFYSHHATDPATGRAQNAFDLARIHLYGHLDEGIGNDVPPNRRPSHDAMLELAEADPKVRAENFEVDFDKVAEDNDWRVKLRLSPRTGKMIDTVTNWDLVRENDPVFRGLRYNELKLAVETTQDLPWSKQPRANTTFTGVDRSELRQYIEREYLFRPPKDLLEELVNGTAHQRPYNPVLEYLDGLRWDGRERLETCLPGVEATEYTRMVARKALVAAVARMYDPGVKWDHTLVLYGEQDLGKSFWVHKMSRGWSDTLSRIGDKDTLIAMQRAWIMVSDEGFSLRKAESDTMKEFLTRTVDVFRMPYDREAMEHPRRCVIWGTTNDEVFLRNQQGNRRFLIVQCTRKVDFTTEFSEDYIDQVWAEAVHRYKANLEPLYLSARESEMASVEREFFTEEDAITGIVQEYLSTLVPADWRFYSVEKRKQWLRDRADGLVPEGVELMNEVCSKQIAVEALGRRFEDNNRMEARELTAILKRLPGWEQLPHKKRLSPYGPQTVFHRLDTEQDLI